MKRLLAVLAVILVFGTDLFARHLHAPHPRITDDTLTGNVRGALHANLGTAAGQIDVTTKDGFVFLSGEVANARLRARAETAAERVAGVRAVDNALILSRHRGG